MRKSAYGKEIIFMWEGFNNYDEIAVKPAASTLQITKEQQKKVYTAWKAAVAANPEFFDGYLWRVESVYGKMAHPVLNVSPIRYSQHNVLRHIQNQPMSFYPNPLTVNTIQETADGYIVIGVRGKGSDQAGLTLMGAGFVERRKTEGSLSKEPQQIWQVVQKECLEETHYRKSPAFDIGEAKILAIIFGSNHDTTVCFHLPLNANHEDITLGNDEHKDLIFLPNNPEEIMHILETGKYKGIPAADHLLGCLESYLLRKSAGQIKSKYQH